MKRKVLIIALLAVMVFAVVVTARAQTLELIYIETSIYANDDPVMVDYPAPAEPTLTQESYPAPVEVTPTAARTPVMGPGVPDTKNYQWKMGGK